MPLHQLMNKLRKLSIRFGTVRLNTAVMRSQEAQDAAVVLANFDERIGSENHLNSLVTAFPIPFDDHRSDLCHLVPRCLSFTDSVEILRAIAGTVYRTARRRRASAAIS